MRTIVVDDEPWLLKRFAMECESLQDVQLLGGFRSPLKALEFARSNRIDLAFLDVDMPGQSLCTRTFPGKGSCFANTAMT